MSDVRMSWRHAICDTCWDLRFRASRGQPIRVLDRDDGGSESCCFCSTSTFSGIYVRHDPAELFCKGVHKED